jgi:acyl-homoserine-lactone acylase
LNSLTLMLRCESTRALSAWDRSTDATSRGAVLFTTWWDIYTRAVGTRGPYRVRWSEREPLTTPMGLSDATIARNALDSAAMRVKARWNDVSVPWGDVYRLRRDNVDLPANGASGNYGAFRVVTFGAPAEGIHTASGGDSYVGVIEFGRPLRARTLIGYGNASQPGSPHRTNQLQLFASKQLREVWRTRAEIERHLASRQRFE